MCDILNLLCCVYMVQVAGCISTLPFSGVVEGLVDEVVQVILPSVKVRAGLVVFTGPRESSLGLRIVGVQFANTLVVNVSVMVFHVVPRGLVHFTVLTVVRLLRPGHFMRPKESRLARIALTYQQHRTPGLSLRRGYHVFRTYTLQHVCHQGAVRSRKTCWSSS